MGYERKVIGRQAFEEFANEILKDGGSVDLIAHPSPQPCPEYYLPDQLRCIEFRCPTWNRGVRMVAEEVLVVDHRDCDGRSVVSMIVYHKGRRPKIAPPISLKG